MKVAYYRLWGDHTWDVGVMDIPDNTPEYEIENFIRNKRIETFILVEEIPIIVGLYEIIRE